MKKGLKDSEFDFYRWVCYGAGLLILALASLAFPSLIWAFVILLIIAVADIAYCQYFKYAYRYFPTKTKKVK